MGIEPKKDEFYSIYLTIFQFPNLNHPLISISPPFATFTKNNSVISPILIAISISNHRTSLMIYC